MGDVVDLEKRRNELREAVEKTPPEGVNPCPACGDMFAMVVTVPDYTDVDEMGPYALICQHCGEPFGYGFLFEDDLLEEDPEET